MMPNNEPSPIVTDAEFGEGFIGYAPTQPSSAETPLPPATLSPQAAPADPASRLSSSPLASETSARGPFLDWIARFTDWVRENYSATGIFILDREGAVIFDESGHGRLHFLARSLALASRRPGASVGNVHVKIGAGATLELIPVDTAYGFLVLGAVVPEALDPQCVSTVMQALSQVAAPPAKV